jgi:hypothetical protein
LNYENGKAATPKYTPPIEVLINASKVLRSGKKEKEVKLDLLPTLAPLFDERCSYNAMIEYVTISKLKG